MAILIVVSIEVDGRVLAPSQGNARAVLLGSAVAIERTIFGVSHVVVLVTHFGANGAHTDAVNHFASVTVVPVLVHEVLLGLGERAQLLVQLFLALIQIAAIIGRS